MTKWALQDAKANFSDFLDSALTHGPQLITKQGVETAVLVASDEWLRLQQATRRSPIDFLLGDGPRFDLPLPDRGKQTWRTDRSGEADAAVS